MADLGNISKIELPNGDIAHCKDSVSGYTTSTSITAALTTSGWSNKTQTVNVTGVTANNDVVVSAAPSMVTAYSGAGIVCTAQAAGTLTFTCETVPTSAITVNVLILN